MKGYHIGALNRKYGSEDITQLDGGRSTGFFGGPGCYFTLGEYNDSYRRRWASPSQIHVWEINLSPYKLLRGGETLHKFLKLFNSYVRNFPLMNKDLDSWMKCAHYAEDITDGGYDGIHPFESFWSSMKFLNKNNSNENNTHDNDEDNDEDDYEMSDNMREYLIDEQNEQISHLFTLMGEADEKYESLPMEKIVNILSQNESQEQAQDAQEYAQELDSFPIFHMDRIEGLIDVKRELKFYSSLCNFPMKKVETIAEEIFHELEPYYDTEDGYLSTFKYRSKLQGQMAIPARFIEKLGYDGILPDSSTNNYTYGGVIYDNRLRREDIHLLKENLHNTSQRNILMEQIYHEAHS